MSWPNVQGKEYLGEEAQVAQVPLGQEVMVEKGLKGMKEVGEL